MQELIKKADVLIEAMPYIQKFRNKVIVVKAGGSAMENKEHLQGMLEDVTFMECVGMLPVLVHGGGKSISRKMQEAGIQSKFLNGFRVTCEKSIKVVEQVIKEDVNYDIVKRLTELGATAKTLPGELVFKVEKKVERDERTGELLDWGFVGEPVSVDTDLIMPLIAAGIIPVIYPLGTGPDGKIYNINADTAAAAVAKALKVWKLAFLTDVPGLMRNPEDPETIITTIKASQISELKDKGIIKGGMLPKVESMLEALDAGVKKIHIIDGRMPHSLLLEIFTDKGVGTEILRNEQD